MYLQFWKAFGIYITGSVGQVSSAALVFNLYHGLERKQVSHHNLLQAIPLLRSLTSDDTVGPACLATLLHAANASHISDPYSITEQLESERISASDEALLLLAIVQWHCNDLEAGLLTLDQLEESAAADEIQRTAKAINAWILLSQAGIAKPHATVQEDESEDDVQDAESNIAEARSMFRLVLAADPSHIEVRFQKGSSL